MSKKIDLNRIADLLGRSKLFTLLAVIILYLSSIMLVVLGIVKFYYNFYDIIVKLENAERVNLIMVTVDFIIIIEIYLLSIIFYIFAIGIYKLFVGEFMHIGWYHIESLDDIKAELAKAIVVFLSVFLLQKIVEWKEPQQLVYFGAIIIFTCGYLIWFAKTLRNDINQNHNNHHSNTNNKTNFHPEIKE